MMKAVTTTALLLMIFFVFVMLGNSPTEKIERSCEPVLWVGNVVESVFLLADSDWSDDVKETTEEIDYSCRYIIWRAFYEEEYLEFKNGEGS